MKIYQYKKYFSNFLKNFYSLQRFKFVNKKNSRYLTSFKFKPIHSIEQKLLQSDYLENKKNNIRIAISKIENIPIFPGEIFSFYHLVGMPSISNGYLAGRSLIKGKLTQSIGGGLCQLSGLIYHLAIESGMQIIERHPHTVDLYSNETRFTPLGLDAAVSYLNKDLKFKNSLNCPVYFKFKISSFKLKITLYVSKNILIYSYCTSLEVNKNYKKVRLYRFSENNFLKKEFIGTSIYLENTLL